MTDLQLGQQYEVRDMPQHRLNLSAAMFGEGDLAVDLTIRFHVAELSPPQRMIEVRLFMLQRDRSTDTIDLYGTLMSGSHPFVARRWARVRLISGVATVCIQDHPPRIEF